MGTGTIACQFKEYLSYSEAIKIVHSLKIKTRSEWRRLCQLRVNGISILPKDIPIAPEQVYKNLGWNGYGEWLGTGAIAPQLKKYKSYTKARAFVRSLKLKSQREWIKFCKGQMPSKGTLPLDIPANPHNTYRNKGWKSLGDWLGSGTIAPHFKKYRSFLGSSRNFVVGEEGL